MRASQQGSDTSQYDNIGLSSYAFAIDSGAQSTTNDLNLKTAWSLSWISGQDAIIDGKGHGIHVSDLIAAQANGIGVVRVAPGAEIVSLKVIDFNSTGNDREELIAVLSKATITAIDLLWV